MGAAGAEGFAVVVLGGVGVWASGLVGFVLWGLCLLGLPRSAPSEQMWGRAPALCVTRRLHSVALLASLA